MHDAGTDISAVIPLLNEADVVENTLRQVTRVLEGIGPNYEIIVVDDGSTDDTFELVENAHRANHRIKGIRLSRRFGKESAMLAGLSKAQGKAVVTMDGDLQHPPDLIPEMVEKWRGGAQIVHGVKRASEHGNVLHRAASRIFYRIFSRFAGFNINESSDFKLIDARVVRRLVRDFPEQQRFHRGLSRWVGFRQENVVFEVAERPAGKSGWSLFDLVRYGWSTITSYTSLPLQVVPALGAVMLLVSVVLGAEALVSRIRGESITGFATLEITLLFTGSVIMIGLGVVGQSTTN